jgi:hypothetical protein
VYGDGKRERDRQPTMWVATTVFPTAASHPFYMRLNRRCASVDRRSPKRSATFYAETMAA